jgi:phosphopantothenoylcysteine decarboxylase/phosphopantothenate--cysteine ligase
MNVMMWANPATQANMATLKSRGIHVVGPGSGDLACGEEGSGRLSEPHDILDAMDRLLKIERRLSGIKALVTSGPTHEADPAGVTLRRVETAAEMLAACEAALPVDIAIFAAAVADWRPAQRGNQKLKKNNGVAPSLELTTNPDILAAVAQSKGARPRLVVGFAAETENVIAHAQAKLKKKGCDWILANDVSEGTGTFGGDANRIHLISAGGIEDWPSLSKQDVARRLAARAADFLKPGSLKVNHG